MSKILDARGWACPKPVIETRKVLQTENELTVIVDNKAARENVSRLATKMQFQVDIEEKDDGIYLHINKGKDTPATEISEEELSPYVQCSEGNLVLLITSNTVGRGSDELGEILMRALMHTFLETEPKPNMIILMNNGVKLAVNGSPVIDDLKALSEKGIEILVCGTCLNYFNLTNDVKVGQISNAYTIAESLLQAGRVINL